MLIRRALIITNNSCLFPLLINTMRLQEIIREREPHILRTAAAVGTIEKVIALGNRYGYGFGYIKVDAIADLRH